MLPWQWDPRTVKAIPPQPDHMPPALTSKSTLPAMRRPDLAASVCTFFWHSNVFMRTHTNLASAHTLLVNYHLAQSHVDPAIGAPALPATQTAPHMPIIDESLICRFTKSTSHFLPLNRWLLLQHKEETAFAFQNKACIRLIHNKLA